MYTSIPPVYSIQFFRACIGTYIVTVYIFKSLCNLYNMFLFSFKNKSGPYLKNVSFYFGVSAK